MIIQGLTVQASVIRSTAGYLYLYNARLQDFIAAHVETAAAKAYKQQISEVREEKVESQEGKVLKKEELQHTEETTTSVSNAVVVCIVAAFLILLLLLVRRRRLSQQETDPNKE